MVPMRRSPIFAIFALLAVLGLLAGCGTSGGEDATSSTTTTAAPADGDRGADDTTTTEAGDEDDGDAAATSVDQLKAILPTLKDLDDPAYTDADIQIGGDPDSDDTDDDESGDDPYDEACPELQELDFLNETDTDDDSVSVTFSTEDEREVEVRLDPTASELTGESLDQIVEALNACGSVSIEDETMGAATVTFAAERDDRFGDRGLRLTMNASFSFFGMAIDVDFLGHAFELNGIGVFVSASSGFEESETSLMGTPVPLDGEHVDAMAKLMDQRVGDL